ncbi:family 1 glycosylhydrolase, partial [Nocardioides hankookensis]
VFGPAEMSAVRAVVAEEDLPTALSQNQARQHVAGLLGAPLGGVLFSVTRWLPFAADAVSFAFSWVLLGRIRTDLSAPTTASPRKPAQDLAEGVRFIARHRLFRVLVVWSALANLAVNALFFVAVLRLIAGGFAAYQIGLVETAAGVCGILGAIVAPWLIDRVPTGRLTVLIAWSFVPLVVPMVLWNHPAVVAAALSVGLFLNPAGNAGIGSYRMAVTPPELIGRVQATTQFVSMAAMPLAPVLADDTLVRDADLALVHGSADWLGVNYYTPFRPTLADPSLDVHPEVEAYPGVTPVSFVVREPRTDIGWEVDGYGLEELLVDTHKRTGLPIVVTENGAAYADDVLVEGAAGHVVDDQDRIGYLRDHIAATEAARAAGADVRGYIVWTLLDNFEWAEGYTKTFGVVHIDPEDLARTPKASYHWLSEHIGSASS